MNPSLRSVLIVDDEPAVRDLMSRWVSALGLRAQTAASADEALATLRARDCDLAVIDVKMPGHDGLWLLGELQRQHPQMPVVLATAYSDLVAKDGEDRPVVDLLIKPFHKDRFALAVDRGRQWRKATVEELHWHATLTIELSDRAARLVAQLFERSESGRDEAEVLASMIADLMPDVAEHSNRVADYAISIARQLDIEGRELTALEWAARFHDIGKVVMPEALLTKPSPLTAGEHDIMRLHVDISADILEASRTLAAAAPAVRASHEWFGGSGYPRGLTGAAIPLASRIIAVADAFDAITHDRVYRRGFDSADAVGELLRCTPAQFDPRVVAAFLISLAR
jgi:putative nucleotidyltransferase with HDIG domain